MSNDFGGDTMRIGEATERITSLNGIRVKVKGEDERGVIYNVYINSATKVVQVWVNMDSRCARCFRPHHLEFDSLSLEQSELLGVQGE